MYNNYDPRLSPESNLYHLVYHNSHARIDFVHNQYWVSALCEQGNPHEKKSSFEGPHVFCLLSEVILLGQSIMAGYTTPNTSLPCLLDSAEKMESYMEMILTSILCGIGVVGNISNLAVLRLKRTQNGLDALGRAAIYGLLALAWSDLAFCILGLPAAILAALADGQVAQDRNLQLVRYMYRFYKIPCINIFLFTSTWFIVLVSAERYLVVFHPFRCRKYVSIRRVIVSRVVLAFLSVLINMPLFFLYNVEQYEMGGDCPLVYFFVVLNKSPEMTNIMWVHWIVWASAGTLVPVALLLYTNAMLAVAVRRTISDTTPGAEIKNIPMKSATAKCDVVAVQASLSPDSLESGQYKPDTFRISSTLLAIAVLFVILVTPSMIMNFLKGVIVDPDTNRSYGIAVSVTNLLQVLKFSCNFGLYCGLNKPFRESIC